MKYKGQDKAKFTESVILISKYSGWRKKIHKCICGVGERESTTPLHFSKAPFGSGQI